MWLLLLHELLQTLVLFYLTVDVFSLGCIVDAVGSRLSLLAVVPNVL
jgi:hypothetical protein